MKRVLNTVALTFVATLALVWLAAVAVALTGAVDVASTADHVPGAQWFFSTLSERSIRRHAEIAVEEGDLVPPSAGDRQMLATGAVHYGAMCVVCHGGPGMERGELGRGLKPEPPDLADIARERSGAEILWVLHHGIRHTGMPAFGETHSAEELEAIAALVAQLDEMSPADFERLAGAPGGGRRMPGAEGHAPAGHQHPDGGGAGYAYEDEQHHHQSAEEQSGEAHADGEH